MTRKMWSRGRSCSSTRASAASRDRVVDLGLPPVHPQPAHVDRPVPALQGGAQGRHRVAQGEVEVAGQQVPGAQRDEPHRDPGADEPLGHRPHRPVPTDRDDDVRPLRDGRARLTDPGVRDGRLEPQRLGQPLLRAGATAPPPAAPGRPAWRGWRRTRRAAPVSSTSRASRSSRASGPFLGRLDPPAQLTLPQPQDRHQQESGDGHDGRAHGQPRLPGHGPNLRPTRRGPPRPAQPRPARRGRQRQLTRSSRPAALGGCVPASGGVSRAAHPGR